MTTILYVPTAIFFNANVELLVLDVSSLISFYLYEATVQSTKARSDEQQRGID